MKKSNLIKILIFTPLLTFAQEDSSMSNLLDKYHQIISYWVIDGSDSIDRYLSGTKDKKRLSKTKINLSYEIGTYNTGGLVNNFDFGISLSLPRFKNKAKITLEKVNRDKSLFGNNREAVLSKKDDDTSLDSYNLALKYSQWGGKKSKIGLTGGIRFNKLIVEPYLGVIAGYSIKSNNKENINLKNILRFYLAGEIKDSLSAQYLYNYSSDLLLGWRGNIDYSNKSDEQTFISEFICHKYVNEYKFFRFGFISTASLTNFKHFRKGDFEIYSKIHNKMMDKKWLYYEVTPSLDWKRKDNYKTSVGIKFKIGASFGG